MATWSWAGDNKSFCWLSSNHQANTRWQVPGQRQVKKLGAAGEQAGLRPYLQQSPGKAWDGAWMSHLDLCAEAASWAGHLGLLLCLRPHQLTFIFLLFPRCHHNAFSHTISVNSNLPCTCASCIWIQQKMWMKAVEEKNMAELFKTKTIVCHQPVAVSDVEICQWRKIGCRHQLGYPPWSAGLLV